jgi:hypothetical protein
LGTEEERVAERVSRGALQLPVQITFEPVDGRTGRGFDVHCREGALEIGDATSLGGQLVAERAGDRDLVLRLQWGVEHQGRDRLLGRHLRAHQVRGEDRRQDRQAQNDTEVTGADRPRGMPHPRQAQLHR